MTPHDALLCWVNSALLVLLIALLAAPAVVGYRRRRREAREWAQATPEQRELIIYGSAGYR